MVNWVARYDLAPPQSEDLRRRALLALDLAERTVTSLVAGTPGIDLSAHEAPTDKIVAETAVVCHSLAGVQGEPALVVRAKALAAALVPHARNTRLKTAMLYQPYKALDLAIPHRCLAALGFPDAAFENFLCHVLTSSTALSFERPPHRQLEQVWTQGLASGHAVPSADWQTTALERPIAVLTGSRDDFYAFTHALFYASDFAARAITPRRGAAVLMDAESALSAALDDDDFDLVGELLLTWPGLGVPFSGTARWAFSVLCQIEDEAGVVPSLAITGEAYRRHSDDGEDTAAAYALASSYHPAYVMGLLCARMLGLEATWREVGCTTTAPAPARAVAEAALELLERHPRRPYWEQVLRQCAAPEREGYTSFLVDVALRRAVRGFDLGGAHRLASLAAAEGLMTTALRQTTELLERAARLE